LSRAAKNPAAGAGDGTSGVLRYGVSVRGWSVGAQIDRASNIIHCAGRSASQRPSLTPVRAFDAASSVRRLFASGVGTYDPVAELRAQVACGGNTVPHKEPGPRKRRSVGHNRCPFPGAVRVNGRREASRSTLYENTSRNSKYHVEPPTLPNATARCCFGRLSLRNSSSRQLGGGGACVGSVSV
jgi:hypothetical protein